MEHTLALIQKSHEGDEEARAQLVEENTGLIWCVVKRFYGRGGNVQREPDGELFGKRHACR